MLKETGNINKFLFYERKYQHLQIRKKYIEILNNYGFLLEELLKL